MDCTQCQIDYTDNMNMHINKRMHFKDCTLHKAPWFDRILITVSYDQKSDLIEPLNVPWMLNMMMMINWMIYQPHSAALLQTVTTPLFVLTGNENIFGDVTWDLVRIFFQSSVTQWYLLHTRLLFNLRGFTRKDCAGYDLCEWIPRRNTNCKIHRKSFMVVCEIAEWLKSQYCAYGGWDI